MNETIKEIQEIIKHKYFRQKNENVNLKEIKNLYSHYPFLYYDFYTDIDVEIMKKLSIIGFGLYYNIKLLDDILDDNNINVLPLFIKSYTNILKELFSFIVNNKLQLSLFSKYQKLLDIMLIKFKNDAKKQDLSFDHYIDESYSKSSISLLSLYFLRSISTKKDTTIFNIFLEIDKYFNNIIQLIDDLRDFKNDFDNRTSNSLILFLSKTKNISYSQILDSQYPEIAKSIFLTSIVIEYFRIIEKRIEFIKSKTDKYQLKYFSKIVISVEKDFLCLKQNIDEYRENIFRKKINITKKNLNNSFNQGLNYIESLQNTSENTWHDFLNFAGSSTNWVTSYILSTLPFNIKFIPIVQNIYNKINKQNYYLLGYNDNIPGDFDTTAHVIKAIIKYKENIKNFHLKVIEKSILRICNSINPDSGFGTYDIKVIDTIHKLIPNIGVNVNNCEGWISSHTCVTANVIDMLYIYKKEVNRNVKIDKFLNAAQNFLENRFNPNGYIENYWWNDRLYSLFFSVKYLDNIKKKSIVDFLVECVNNDGGWGSCLYRSEESKPFYTAMVISILNDLHPLFKSTEELIQNGILYLINKQNVKGSWFSFPSLRIPHFSNKNPNSTYKWKKYSNDGFNMIVKDQNNLYTTATCINAMRQGLKFV